MKKLSIISLILLFNCFVVVGQKGKSFPLMPVKTLDGKQIDIPESIKGKNSLLCIVYSQKSEKSLESWLGPIANTFLVENPLNPEPYDINMYFVIMLSGIKDAASGNIESKIKKNLDKDFWGKVAIYQGGIKEYLNQLDFGKKDEPYFCVINKNGTVSYSTTGVYTNDKLQEIETKISE